jgi:hypothetical protein
LFEGSIRIGESAGTARVNTSLVGGDIALRVVAGVNRDSGGAYGFAGVLRNAEVTISSLVNVGAFTAFFAGTQVVAHADIVVGQYAVIQGEDVSLSSNVDARAAAEPTFAMGLGGAVGMIDSRATVTVKGSIESAGNLTLNSWVQNTADVVADINSGALKVAAAAFALAKIDSVSQVQVASNASLTVAGDLVIDATTVDRNRTLARSTAGIDGSVGIALGLVFENGHTNAWLDGLAVVEGSVSVNAEQSQAGIPSGKLKLLPTENSGIAVSASTGTESTGDLLEDTGNTAQNALTKQITEELMKMLDKAPSTGQKSSAPAFSAAGAVAYVSDVNHVLARIGDGTGGDVSAGGSVAPSKDSNTPATYTTRSSCSPSSRQGSSASDSGAVASVRTTSKTKRASAGGSKSNFV